MNRKVMAVMAIVSMGGIFIEALWHVSLTIPGMRVFCGHASTQRILEAYSENRLPRMHLLGGKDGVSVLNNEVSFLSYCGLHFSVKSLDVLAAENLIKKAVSLVEARVRDYQGRADTPV